MQIIEFLVNFVLCTDDVLTTTTG